MSSPRALSDPSSNGEQVDLAAFLATFVPEEALTKYDILGLNGPTALWTDFYSGMKTLMRAARHIKPLDPAITALVVDIFEQTGQYEPNLTSNLTRVAEVDQFLEETVGCFIELLQSAPFAYEPERAEEYRRRSTHGLDLLKGVQSGLASLICVSRLPDDLASSRASSTIWDGGDDEDAEEAEGEVMDERPTPKLAAKLLLDLFKKSDLLHSAESELLTVQRLLGQVEFAAAMVALRFPDSRMGSPDLSNIGVAAEDAAEAEEAEEGKPAPVKHADQARTLLGRVQFLKYCFLFSQTGMNA